MHAPAGPVHADLVDRPFEPRLLALPEDAHARAHQPLLVLVFVLLLRRARPRARRAPARRAPARRAPAQRAQRGRARHRESEPARAAVAPRKLPREGIRRGRSSCELVRAQARSSELARLPREKSLADARLRAVERLPRARRRHRRDALDPARAEQPEQRAARAEGAAVAVLARLRLGAPVACAAAAPHPRLPRAPAARGLGRRGQCRAACRRHAGPLHNAAQHLLMQPHGVLNLLPSLPCVAPQREAQDVQRGEPLQLPQRRRAAAVLRRRELRRGEGTRLRRQLHICEQGLAGLRQLLLSKSAPRSLDANGQ